MTARKPTPESLAVPKAIDRVNPGRWFLGEYDDGKYWVDCMMKMTLVHPVTKAQLIKLVGTGYDADGAFRAELTQHRDFVVLTLTAAQAKRCGLGEAASKS